MIYPQSLESKIGFDGVRTIIENLCNNSLSKDKCKEMNFSSDFGQVLTQLQQTNEYLTILNTGEDFPNGNIYDLREELGRVRIIGAYLTETELFQLGQTLSAAADICAFFTEERSNKFPQLKKIADEVTTFPEILRIITSAIDKFGNMKDNASPTLMELKRSLQMTASSVNGMMQRIMSQCKQEGFLEKDSSPVVRDGRLVIPVSPMHKRKIKGIVHDESATGKTIFIEPAEIVEANNRIRELEADIRREIIRILTEITDKIRPSLGDLFALYKIIGIFDFIRAKASFAQEINATLPHVSETQEIEWYNAIHPMLFVTLKKLNKEVVPLTIKLDKENHILLISGPNAGGKSVCLKTVGIVQYMLQCGILPPIYSNSHFGIFENLFIDIGDEQSIENELSTYSSHLSNMKFFMQKGNAKSLILIDEFGGGTEPQIGGAIAQAILHKLNDAGIFGVITTHYQNLKNFANDTSGIVNGAMLYDRHLMKPLFQLSVGNPGSSFAVEIARKIGIPDDVIDEAESIVGSDYINMDKYLLDIARDRKYWENKRQDIRIERKKLENLVTRYESDIERLKLERHQILKEAKSEAKEIIASSNASIENAIHEIKKAQAEKERTKEIRKQIEELKSRLANDETDSESSAKLDELSAKIRKKKHKHEKPVAAQPQTEEKPLAVGDSVTIDGSSSVGEIIEINGKNAIVTFGIFKSTVQLSKLKRTLRKATSTAAKDSFISSSTTDEMRNKQLNFKQDIDVRGMRADEAIQAVSYFIDDATQFNIKQVRILHGTGYGILRQRIREYLNTVPSIKSFKDEHVQFGGAGITVVTLY